MRICVHDHTIYLHIYTWIYIYTNPKAYMNFTYQKKICQLCDDSMNKI